MDRYFLHCTDGTDFVLDGQGITVETREQALRYATSLSERLMHSVPDYEDWESWVVCVYDGEDRMVGTVPFRKPIQASGLCESTDQIEASRSAAQIEAPRLARPYPSVRDVCRHVRSVYATAAARWRRQPRREGEPA
jgi:hypothetical protein